MKKTLAAIAALGLIAGCANAQPAPEALLHYQTIGTVSAHQAQAETNRLLALTSIANGTTDERVKDRAINELARGVQAPPAVTQWVAPPNPFLQALGLVVNPLATIYSAKIGADTQVKLGEQSVIRHGQTMGVIGQGIGATQSLGEAAIQKLPELNLSVQGFGAVGASVTSGGSD